MGASTYLANNVLDHVLKTTAFAQPTNVYASLHSADPGTTGTGRARSQAAATRGSCTTPGTPRRAARPATTA